MSNTSQGQLAKSDSSVPKEQTAQPESEDAKKAREAKEKLETEISRAKASLIAAAKGGFDPLVRMLIKKHRSNNSFSQDYVEKILNGKDNDGCSALYHAAFIGHVDTVELLLAQEGIKANQKNFKDATPLRAALGTDNPEAAELLLEYEGKDAERNAVVSVDGSKKYHLNWNPLCHASGGGFIHVVRLLLKRENVVGRMENKVRKDSELELQNSDGMTALYLASNGGHVRVVKSLLEAGAKVDEPSKGNLMPLYGAASAGKPRVVEILLEKGAKQEHRTEEGDSALDAAVKNGHGAVAELLMEHTKSQEGDSTK